MLLAAVGSLYVSPALAGPLATDPNAYTNGLGQTFHGSSPLIPDYGPGAPEGYFDWAVYAYGHLPPGYVGVEADPGQFLYAFQFYNTGPAPVNLVYIFDPSTANGLAYDLVGVFTSDDISGIPGSASYEYAIAWEFVDPILQGESTIGLVYSSSGWPYLGAGWAGGGLALNDFGNSGASVVWELPWPVPEPSSFLLAALGLIGLADWGRRRKR